jgi:alpha-galactosidase
MQGQTYGLSFWVPLSAGVVGSACREAGVSHHPDAYSVRSGYSPAMVMCWFGNEKTMPGRGFDDDTARRLLNEYRRVRQYFYGDYYPLTRYNLDDEHWLAWQFDRPDLGEGMVQVFRRGRSSYETARFFLKGLDPEANYRLTDTDDGRPSVVCGAELMERGLLVKIEKRPHAVVMVYEKVKP